MSASPPPESIVNLSTPEYRPDEAQEFYEIASAMGNYEAKLVVYGIAATHPNQSFSARPLRNQVRDLQGNAPGWVPGPSTLLSYCSSSLGPIGFVLRDDRKTEKGSVEAWRADPAKITFALALAGYEMDWSIDNPGLGLLKLLGPTSSPTGVRAPEVRIRFLEEIIKTEKVKSVDEVAAATGLPAALVRETASDLETNQFVNFGSATKLEDRKIAIKDKTEDEPIPAFARRTPEYQLLQDTVDYLRSRNVKSLTARQFMDLAATLAPPDGIDSVKLRAKLVEAMTQSWVGSIVPEKRVFNQGKRTSISIKEEFREPIHNLLNIFREIRKVDTQFLKEGRIKAREILADPDRVAFLMDKARRTSSHANGRTLEEWKPIVTHIVSELGAISLQQFRQELSDLGYPSNRSTVRLFLGRLAEAGTIRTFLQPKTPDSTRLVTFIDLPED